MDEITVTTTTRVSELRRGPGWTAAMCVNAATYVAVSLAALEAEARRRGPTRSLAAHLRRASDRPHVIAEVKRASPSAGVLRDPYDPAGIARAYAAAGAVGISVLTEPHRFRGAPAHLRAVHAAVDLPVLRKDFVVDPYQVAEAAAWGADVVLLIVAALDPSALRALHDAIRQYGMETLVEAHDEAELEEALTLEDALVGVNSRNLKTLRTDLAVAERLAARIPRDRLAIAESGIRTRADMDRLSAVGYRGFLIGESLLRAPDPGDALRRLLAQASGSAD
jgi:indole-3-glycerol phosphate synthase